MHKRVRRYGFRSIALGTAIILFLLISAPAALFAGNVPVPPEMKGSSIVTIQAKGKDVIFVNERPFIITEKTVIWDLSGQEIDLSELVIPCEAEIKYRLRPHPEDPVCLEIKVKSMY
ncbi:MAG: hypothetical protein ISS65_11610 [Desulfobacterales bacterium]|nr:hypothetical protein [Desulfobacterales bacterium]